MAILISGGAGFIGGHLVECLLTHNNDVLVVDDLTSNPISWETLKAEILQANSDYPAILDHLEFWQEPIETFHRRGSGGKRLEGIYHLASPVGPAGILPFAGDIIKYITEGTYAVIELALRHNCRLCYISTSEIYGGGIAGLCSEDTPCVVPIAAPTARLEYAIGKLAGEIAVLNTPDLDAVIVRPFNVAGPRQSDKGGFVLPRFVKQALAGQPLTVFGDGSQRRAFTHVLDIVDGLVRAMERGKSGQAYNLGNPANKTTIMELAAAVILSTPLANLRDPFFYTDGQTIYGPTYAEASDKFPNADKAMSELGWQPSHSIDETIRDVIDYERSRILNERRG